MATATGTRWTATLTATLTLALALALALTSNPTQVATFDASARGHAKMWAESILATEGLTSVDVTLTRTLTITRTLPTDY